MEQERKVVFSGVQPSGVITLGNYLGAVKNWADMQEQYDCIYCIVNLHAITVRQDAAKLKKNTLEAFAIMLACGIDPQKSIAFIQSHGSAHAELSWILNCYTQFGELSRMTQFKDKSSRYSDNINAGLFDYPVLMAADILLYQTDLVPVGVDQKQHVELARDIATRFNGLYGDVFRVPECYFPKMGAKIMSLAEPNKKMSKSDSNPKAYVSILDERDTIIKKFKGAITDSEAKVIYSPEQKEGVSNLMTIYGSFTKKTYAEIESEFNGKGYGDFKLAVGEVVSDALSPIKSEFNRLLLDKSYLESIYHDGAKRADKIAQATLDKVYEKIGFIK